MANAPVSSAVAGRIRQLRRERDWSAQHLAALCAAAGMPSLTRGTIAKIESGVRKSVTAEELAVLSTVFEVPAAELLGMDPVIDGLLRVDERQQLHDLVREVRWERPHDLYRMAFGLYAPLPGPEAVDVVDLLSHLEDVNAGPDGMPPLLVFVEQLARRVQPPIADRLRAWNRGQAHRVGVGAALAALERDVGDTQPWRDSEAYLVFVIEPDLLDPDLLRLQCWRQLGPEWSPRRGEDFVGDLRQIQRHVAQLVTEAEVHWASESVTLRLEFVLPRALLTLPVDEWRADADERMAVPLGLRYPVTIRSLDRMRAPRWHREWRRRWLSLTDQVIEPLMWTERDTPRNLVSLDAKLAVDERRNVLVLGRAPSGRPHDFDVIDIGLRTGVPVMVWPRDDRFADELQVWINDLVHRQVDLREGAWRLRADAFGSGNPHAHIGGRLTLLWDDPDRPVQSPPPMPPVTSDS